MGGTRTLASAGKAVLVYPLPKCSLASISGHNSEDPLRRIIEFPAAGIADCFNGSIDRKRFTRLTKRSAEDRHMTALDSVDEKLKKVMAASGFFPEAVSVVVEVGEN